MKLTFLGTTSGDKSCPTLYATDRGTYVVQGYKVEDAEALGEVDQHGNGLPANETLVEIPAELLAFVPPAPQGS